MSLLHNPATSHLPVTCTRTGFSSSPPLLSSSGRLVRPELARLAAVLGRAADLSEAGVALTVVNRIGSLWGARVAWAGLASLCATHNHCVFVGSTLETRD